MLKTNEPQEIDYAFYDSLSTEELEAILRDDIAEAEPTLDVSVILYVAEKLAARKRDAGQIHLSAKESWQSFQDNYLADMERPQQTVLTKPKKWKRFLSAAAVLAITCTISLYATASDHNPFPGIIQWTKDTFSFSTSKSDSPPPPDTIGRYPVDSEAELFEIYGIPQLFIPTWLPDGYVFEDSEVYETPFQIDALLIYRNGENEIRYSIRSIHNEYTDYIENSEEVFYEVYFSGDMPFYIFKNYDSIQATWHTNLWEYYLSGYIPKEELIQIIDSMEKG